MLLVGWMMGTNRKHVDAARVDADIALFESFARLGDEMSQHEMEFYWPAQREAIEVADELEASLDMGCVTERLPGCTPPA